MIDGSYWNVLAKKVHADCVAAGWWDEYPRRIDRYETAMMLVLTEIAEGVEGLRKNLDDTHLPQYKMFDVELADAAIRILDIAGSLQIVFYDLEKRVDFFKQAYITRAPVEQMYYASKYLCNSDHVRALTDGLAMVIAIAEMNLVPIQSIIGEKRRYNKQREDHKREVRDNTEHGKKF